MSRLGPLTIDASVFLNAVNPPEVGHERSRALLARLRTEADPIIVPTLLLPEVAGAIARGRQDAALARDVARTISRLPHLVLVALTTVLAQRALEVAAEHRLRGSDAVYATVAMQFGTTLVTLDREQRERVSRAVPTKSPADLV
ncbi:MAG TPA: type II toxin-antitoxin system VapC family toxin [bacterium]|nr:type II toxin-antitoxin system VapC family toxin [bacterium]